MSVHSSTVSADRTPHTTDRITLPVGHWHEWTQAIKHTHQQWVQTRPTKQIYHYANVNVHIHEYIWCLSLSLSLSHTHSHFLSKYFSSFFIDLQHTHTHTHTQTHTHTHAHTHRHILRHSDWLKYKSLQMTTVCIYSHFQMTNAHVLHVLCNMQDARFIKFWLIKHTVTWPTYLTTPHKLLTSQCAKINKCVYHYSLNNKNII